MLSAPHAPKSATRWRRHHRSADASQSRRSSSSSDPSTSPLEDLPKKLTLRVTNPTTSGVVITSIDFEMGGRLHGHPDRLIGTSGAFAVDFLAYTNSSGKDVYVREIFLKPHDSVKAWLGLDSASDDDVARDALAKAEVGTWRYTCHWLAEPMEVRTHEQKL